jgi:hypothetical protein
MTASERLEAVFVDARRIFPKLSEEFEGGVSHSWANDPWQRGAWAQYNVGQIRNIPLNPAARVEFILPANTQAVGMDGCRARWNRRTVRSARLMGS